MIQGKAYQAEGTENAKTLQGGQRQRRQMGRRKCLEVGADDRGVTTRL